MPTLTLILTWGGLLIGLSVFGIFYNSFVTFLENQGYHEGYVSHLVVVGCSVTIAASTLVVGIDAAWKVFACFFCSGLPMVIGSMWRYAQKRRRGKETASQEIGKLIGLGQLWLRYICEGEHGDATGDRENELDKGSGDGADGQRRTA